jgi:RNase P/RNase MRP subunit p30
MDLCISLGDQPLSDALPRVREIYACLQRLGYTGAALEYATTLPLRPKDECKRASFLPSPSAASAGAPASDLVSAATVILARKQSGSMLTKRDARRLAQRAPLASSSAGAPAVPQLAGHKRQRQEGAAAGSDVNPLPAPAAFHEYRRITIALDPSGSSSGSGFTSSRPLAAELKERASILATYDLVAVQPSDAAGLVAAVAAGSGALVDIVTLDMSSGRLPFPLTPKDLAALQAAGIVLELRYAPAIRDASMRRAFFAHAATLLRITRGAGLLLASGARSALEVRAPRAVAAIASLAGFTLQQAHVALTAAPAAALAHAARRRLAL